VGWDYLKFADKDKKEFSKMTRLRQRTITFSVVLCLFTLVLVPMGYGSTMPQNGAVLSTVADTGPTLPPLPWCGA
jgi:hypothetical protein